MIYFHAIVESQPEGWLKATFPDFADCSVRAKGPDALLESAQKALLEAIESSLAIKRSPAPRPVAVPGAAKWWAC